MTGVCFYSEAIFQQFMFTYCKYSESVLEISYYFDIDMCEDSNASSYQSKSAQFGFAESRIQIECVKIYIIKIHFILLIN